MTQEPLFFDDWREALRYAVAALGGPKVVGSKMRPDMKPDHAARWLNDCLNQDRREHLSPDHLMHLLILARQAGVHAGMQYMTEECGYRAQPVEPADERTELMRQYVESAKVMERIAKRIEAAEMRTMVKAV